MFEHTHLRNTAVFLRTTESSLLQLLLLLPFGTSERLRSFGSTRAEFISLLNDRMHFLFDIKDLQLLKLLLSSHTLRAFTLVLNSLVVLLKDLLDPRWFLVLLAVNAGFDRWVLKERRF